jgi:hypothetical protein
VWLFVFVTTVPFILYGELFQISLTRLDPVEAFQEATLPGISAEEDSEDLGPYDSSETELSLSLEESTWLITTAERLADDLSAKGHSREYVMHILSDEVGDSFWLLEYDESIHLLENCLVAEEWCGFYRTTGAVAVCGIAAIAVAVVWWYS